MDFLNPFQVNDGNDTDQQIDVLRHVDAVISLFGAAAFADDRGIVRGAHLAPRPAIGNHPAVQTFVKQ